MHYSQTPEKANEIAAQVLERIRDEALAPTPELYELWYVYYAALNPEVTRAIDILVEGDQALTGEKCQEIHQRFLSDVAENERVKLAGDTIQKTIKTVGGAMSSVKNATSDYNTALEAVSGKLEGDEIDLVEAKAAINEVVSNTHNMMRENEKLEAELHKSTEVMQELQRDLEIVRKEALTDGLTNLANRKAFDSEIERIRQESLADDMTFCLVMMDIDHFKGFNDNYGHQVGDQVLRLVAQTLFEGVKGRDVVARYGGEEFAIILPTTELQSAAGLADSLRYAVAVKEIVNRNSGERLGRITLSGGAAEFVTGESVEDLIARADAALYTAKHNGRNQISSAPAPGQKQTAG